MKPKDPVVHKEARHPQTWYVFSVSKQRIAPLRNGCKNHFSARANIPCLSLMWPLPVIHEIRSLRHERHVACSGWQVPFLRMSGVSRKTLYNAFPYAGSKRSACQRRYKLRGSYWMAWYAANKPSPPCHPERSVAESKDPVVRKDERELLVPLIHPLPFINEILSSCRKTRHSSGLCPSSNWWHWSFPTAAWNPVCF